MRVCFLVPALSRSGGIDVIQGHARRLAADHGAEAVVVDAGDRDAVARACGARWDVALATWWTTIPLLARIPAARRGVFAQGYDPLHYRSGEFVDRMAATTALAAPYGVIGVSEWVCRTIGAARPGARCAVARPGVDKDVFGGAPRALADGPLRVLVEGQPTVWFKGVADAIAAARAMARRPHVTLAALDPAGASDAGADRVVGGLDAPAMAALYREADVVVKLSRFEGLGLAPLEGFHAGVPCVVTPYGGHAEYLEHGVNGLLVGFGDLPATTRALDRLDEDRALLARLSEGALRTAADWPDPAAATIALVTAFDTLDAGEHDPAALDAVARLAAADRGTLARLHATIAARDAALAHEHDRIDELERSRAELGALLAERQAQLEDYGERLGRSDARILEIADELEQATSSRAYRAAIALRSLLPGRR